MRAKSIHMLLVVAALAVFALWLCPAWADAKDAGRFTGTISVDSGGPTQKASAPRQNVAPPSAEVDNVSFAWPTVWGDFSVTKFVLLLMFLFLVSIDRAKLRPGLSFIVSAPG